MPVSPSPQAEHDTLERLIDTLAREAGQLLALVQQKEERARAIDVDAIERMHVEEVLPYQILRDRITAGRKLGQVDILRFVAAVAIHDPTFAATFAAHLPHKFADGSLTPAEAELGEATSPATLGLSAVQEVPSPVVNHADSLHVVTAVGNGGTGVCPPGVAARH
jgi:hypothetical protein